LRKWLEAVVGQLKTPHLCFVRLIRQVRPVQETAQALHGKKKQQARADLLFPSSN
jgi:hypothetical protein